MNVRKRQGCAVIVGVGNRVGLGGALCARVAKEMPVYAVGRSTDKVEALVSELLDQGLDVEGVSVDATKPQEVSRLFHQIADQEHTPELVVFNAAEVNLPKSFLDMEPGYIENMWRVCYLGGVLVAQEAIKQMLPYGKGTMIFTGATASVRGGAQFGAFAAAKAALRSHAQSMAREFGVRGIHVAHVIVDGVVDGLRVGNVACGLGKVYVKSKGEDGALKPSAVVDSYWHIHRQHPSAWTHEMDLRPHKEKF